MKYTISPKRCLILFIGLFTQLLAYSINTLPNKATGLCNDTIMHEDTLQEVRIYGDSVFQYVDKDIIRITDYMRRSSRNTGEMLGKIPGMNYSRFDRSLSYHGEKNIIILVDSVEKNADYIKRLHHIRFNKVEVIPHPTGKYADYDVVVNLHKSPDYEGFENNTTASEQIMLDALDNKLLDATDWSESFTYTKNKWNINLNYDGNFYQRGLVSYGSRIYTKNNYKQTVIPNADNSSNSGRYTRTNAFSVAADYQIDKRNSFSFLYKYDHDNNDAYGRRTEVISDIVESYHDTTLTRLSDKERGDVNSVGLYYRGGISKWNYNVTLNYVNHTWNSLYGINKASGYANTDNRNQKMYHTFTNVDVNRSMFSNKLYLDMSYSYFWRKYDQLRMNTDIHLNKNILSYHSVCASLSYNISRSLGLSVSGTATMYDSDYGGNDNRYNTYSGAFGFVSKLYRQGWLRLTYSCNASNPRLDQLTTYSYFTDSLNWKTGNPYLKATLAHNIEMRYNIIDGISLTSKLVYAPRNFVNIVESRQGYLQDGTLSYYAANQVQNGSNMNWYNSLYVNKSFGNFSIAANVNYNYFRYKYKDYRKSSGAWNGNCELTYVLNPYEIYIAAIYKLINTYTLAPQSIMKDHYDITGISISKTFLNDNLEVFFSYVSPIHLTSMKGSIDIITPAYISQGYNDNKYHINNVLNLSISYRLTGGKSIRKYKRSMSNER